MSSLAGLVLSGHDLGGHLAAYMRCNPYASKAGGKALQPDTLLSQKEGHDWSVQSMWMVARDVARWTQGEVALCEESTMPDLEVQYSSIKHIPLQQSSRLKPLL